MKISLNNISEAALLNSPRLPSLKEAVVEAFRYQRVNTLTSDQVTETSIFGTPIWMSLTIDAFQWKEIIGSTVNIRKVPEFHIPCVICEVSFQKHIIETYVQRQRIAGPFYEHITFGAYEINIKGILSNDNDQYPIDLVNYLNEIVQAPVSFGITHTILNKLGIYKLVVMAGTPIVDAGGRTNLQPFTLSCKSDDSRSLIINEAGN